MDERLKRLHEFLNRTLFTPAQYLTEYAGELRRFAGDKRLHLGCGDGATLANYAPAPSATIGLDLDRGALARYAARRRVTADAMRLPFLDGSLDVVHAEHVLEHIADPARLMTEVSRVLKPGGCFIFVTPNAWSYVALAARLVPLRFRHHLIEVVSGRASDAEHYPTYYRANTVRALERLINGSALEVIRLDGYVSEPSYTTGVPIVHLAAVGWHYLLERCRLHRVAGLTLLGVARKPEVSSPCVE